MKWVTDVITEDGMAQSKCQRTSEYQPEFELIAVLVAVRVWSDKLPNAGFAVFRATRAGLYVAGRLNMLAGELAVRLAST